MFLYVRLIAAIIFSAIIIGVYFAGSYFESMVLDRTLKPVYTNQSRLLTNNFYTNIWNKHSSKGDTVSLPNTANDFINSQPLLKFFVHSTEGELLFTTNNRRINALSDSTYSEQFRMAADGNIVSTILKNAPYRESDSLTKQGDLLRVMLPLHASETSSIEGVVIIYYDVKAAISKLEQLHWFFVIAVSVLCAALFLALYFISSRAEYIINQQESATKELIDAKELAEAQNQEKSQFLANVSHELRTPLNAIIGFSDIIKGEVMGSVGNPQYKEYARDINASGVHLLSLINDILDFSKAEAGKLEVDSTDMDLTKLAKNSLRIISTKAQESNIKLLEEIPEKHIVIKADPKRMKQVLLNLLSNAVKFTPEDGEVKLLIEEHADHIKIEVQDSGIGISAKDISKALSSFGQIDSSLSRKHDGTGLGLPFSKRLVEMMGGKFSIKSEDTIGTLVTLHFPKTS